MADLWPEAPPHFQPAAVVARSRRTTNTSAICLVGIGAMLPGFGKAGYTQMGDVAPGSLFGRLEGSTTPWACGARGDELFPGPYDVDGHGAGRDLAIRFRAIVRRGIEVDAEEPEPLAHPRANER